MTPLRSAEILRRIRHVIETLGREGFRFDSPDPEIQAIVKELGLYCPAVIEGLKERADEIEGTAP